MIKIKKHLLLGPMVSFRGERKLSSYLVRTKLYPLERSVGSFKCNGKRSQVCINVAESKLSWQERVIVSTAMTNALYICLLNNKCKMQCGGKTFDDFCLQWNY